MKVTTQKFTKSVKGWLEEENASVLQAMQLQAALEAGAIDGGNYIGNRSEFSEAGDRVYHAVNRHSAVNGPLRESEKQDSCGCLVDTFERLKSRRPRGGSLRTASSETFWFATMIGRGDTPSSSKWARAAVRGIAQYIAALEVGSLNPSTREKTEPEPLSTRLLTGAGA